jgi:hypothetical protein
MTAISRTADPLAKALAPIVREMLLAEVERLAAMRAATKPSRADVEIEEACAAVARAADRHAGAKFTRDEIPARLALEKAATRLGRVMHRHGRMPRGE